MVGAITFARSVKAPDAEDNGEEQQCADQDRGRLETDSRDWLDYRLYSVVPAGQDGELNAVYTVRARGRPS